MAVAFSGMLEGGSINYWYFTHGGTGKENKRGIPEGCSILDWGRMEFRTDETEK